MADDQALRLAIETRYDKRTSWICRVTDPDLKAGKPCDGKSCPISLALQRQLGIEVNLRFRERDHHFELGGRRYIVDLPDEAIDFVRHYDNGVRNMPLPNFLVTAWPLPAEAVAGNG